MSTTLTPELPSEGWSLRGIAYVKIALARTDLTTAASLVRNGDTYAATELLATIIEELESAYAHIA